MRQCEDDDEIIEEVPLAVGNVIPASGSDPSDAPVAVLWLPDVEAPNRWREHTVRRTQPTKPTRTMGFRTPKGSKR